MLTATATRWRADDLRARDPKALAAVVTENLPTLLAGALALGLSRPDAEEVVQETFVAFLSGVDRFERRSTVRTYLFGILYHKASNLRTKARREAGSDDIEAVADARFDSAGMWTRPPLGPEAKALNDETRMMIVRCAECLSEDQRAVFFFKEVAGEDPKTICDIMGVSETNLRVLLHRAKLKLRESLEKAWEMKERPI